MEEKQIGVYKRIIAVLLVLVILSAAALIGWIIFLHSRHSNGITVVLPDNRIEQSSAVPVLQPTALAGGAWITRLSETTPPASSIVPEAGSTIALYRGQASDNARFHVRNMLPGDTQTQYFAVAVSHGEAVEVFFNAQVTKQSKNLANILHIRVTAVESGKLLYDGSFAGMDADGYSQILAAAEQKQTIAYYKIEVSMPASAGNEYQAAMLEAKFNWFVKDTGPLEPPKVGDESIVYIGAAIAVSVLAICLLLLPGKRAERKAG